MTDLRALTVGGRHTTTHLAMPRRRAEAGVLVLHPWWGLNADTTTYVDRLADAGFAAAAPDLYAGKVATTIADAERMSDELNEDLADALVVASVDSLGAEIGDPSARIATLGFSMGAAWAVWLPAQRPEVAATVVYYGTVSGTSLTRARTPVLAHFAESDPYESDDGVAAFEGTLRTAGRAVTIHRYPGTGHWFAEPSNAAYDEAAAELAFGRTIEFLRRELLDRD
jgi:carboxymethylenebutenolidase